MSAVYYGILFRNEHSKRRNSVSTMGRQHINAVTNLFFAVRVLGGTRVFRDWYYAVRVRLLVHKAVRPPGLKQVSLNG